MIARRIVPILFALLIGAAPAMAQAAKADPPGRVGRLSYIEGTVSFHDATDTDWSPATRNYPVTTGNAFWTEPGAKAEIQVGPTVVRMDETTELDVPRLDDQAMSFNVMQGVIDVTLRAPPRGDVTVVTPRGEVVLTQKGIYRIDAGHSADNAPLDPVQVTVLDGAARFHGPRGALEIQRGDSATIAGDPATYAVGQAAPAPIDEWAQSRERSAVARPPAAPAGGQYVPQDMTGYEDLNANGQWSTDPTYGPVWYPAAVPAGWAPYRYGHWAWVEPWGWTWIDDAPWGFAPFHYGRWAFIGGTWGWCPGVAVAAPVVYAPALVSFVGVGAGWGVSLSIGIGSSVGWFPLAPFEVYRPYYPTSVAYVRNVNITNVNKTVINNITNVNVTNVNNFKNHEHSTFVSEKDFTHGGRVHGTAFDVPRDRWAGAKTNADINHLRPSGDGRQGEARAEHAPGPRSDRLGMSSRGGDQRGPNGRGDNGTHAPGPSFDRHGNAADREASVQQHGGPGQADQPRAPGPSMQRPGGSSPQGAESNSGARPNAGGNGTQPGGGRDSGFFRPHPIGPSANATPHSPGSAPGPAIRPPSGQTPNGGAPSNESNASPRGPGSAPNRGAPSNTSNASPRGYGSAPNNGAPSNTSNASPRGYGSAPGPAIRPPSGQTPNGGAPSNVSNASPRGSAPGPTFQHAPTPGGSEGGAPSPNASRGQQHGPSAAERQAPHVMQPPRELPQEQRHPVGREPSASGGWSHAPQQGEATRAVPRGMQQPMAGPSGGGAPSMRGAPPAQVNRAPMPAQTQPSAGNRGPAPQGQAMQMPPQAQGRQAAPQGRPVQPQVVQGSPQGGSPQGGGTPQGERRRFGTP